MLFKNNLVLLLFLINISYINSFSFETDFKLKPIVGNGFNEDLHLNAKYDTIDDVIKDARILVNTFMAQNSVPGAVMAFSINGTNVWTEGFGYTDIENNVSTHKDSVWRLGSISKTCG